jgi:hypothetical protein
MSPKKKESQSQDLHIEYEKVFPLWVWAIYLFLFLLSIPWYLPDQVAMQLIFGLPFWLISCIVAILLMALFSVWIISKYWKD